MNNISDNDYELQKAVKKSWRRLVPYMCVLYFVAYIDRINIGFAKDSMSADLGLTAEAFAFGAGIFFIAYACFGIPSNLMMHKFGARRWLGITTIVWGLISALTGFVQNENQFIIMRFLLGLGEAGFYPGLLFLTSIFFPDKYRSSVISIFVISGPIALAIASPLSGALLELHGFLGKQGWFWLFVLEGLPAVLIGIFGLIYLDDTPLTAKFLTQRQRELLSKRIDAERNNTIEKNTAGAFRSIRVLHLALIYGTIQMAFFGIVFFMPSQMAHLLGDSLGFRSSLISAIPWIFASVGVYFIPRIAQKNDRLRIPVATTCMLVASLSLVISSYTSPFISIASLSLCLMGLLSVQPIFWSYPARVLSTGNLAAGLAICTTFGALFSFLAPIARVHIENWFNSEHASAFFLALIALFSAMLILFLNKMDNPLGLNKEEDNTKKYIES